MGDHRSLGRARRPAGVNQRRHVVRPDGLRSLANQVWLSLEHKRPCYLKVCKAADRRVIEPSGWLDHDDALERRESRPAQQNLRQLL